MGIPSLFTARAGIDIGIHVITGDGAPGDSGGRADSAVIGSIYLDQTSGEIHIKDQSGTGTDKWVRIQNQDDMDSMLAGLSWREPARLYDTTVYGAKSITGETTWVGSTAYALDDLVVPDASPNAHCYKCTTAGTSDVSEPTWPTDGSTVADGTSVWEDQGLIAELVVNLTPYEIDGVVVANGDRILFDNITGSDKNAYLVTGTPGSGATLVEDHIDGVTVQETKGDALYVEEGSTAGRKYTYNGTDWVQQGAAERTELGYIRNFVGKTGEGSETPDYSSTNVVSDGDTLETASGKLDAEIGAAVATPHSRTAGPISDQAVNLNVEALDDAIGADVTSTNQVTAADTVNENLTALDLAVGDDVAGPASRTVGAVSAQDVNSNVEQLDTAIGPDVTSTKHVSAANDVNANISILDDVAGDAKTESKTDSVTTATTVDSVKVDDVLGAEWFVHARSTVTATNVWAGKILAIHNGTSGADATAVDYNTFAILKLGSAIPALDFECDLDGVGAAQVMRLRASSNEAADIRVTRSVLNVQA